MSASEVVTASARRFAERWISVAALGLTLVFFIMLFTSLQRLRLPEPTGEFSVGQTSLTLPASGTANGVPQVRLWYPSSAGTQPAAAAQTKFPLLIYFPGWTGNRIDNENLVRELVSHGFAVATVVYPSGAQQPPMDFSSQSAFQETLRIADDKVRGRAADASRVLDRVTAFNAVESDSHLGHRLDLDRVGIFGFSFGGAVAAQACWADSRFKAAVNMDGWHFAEAARDGVARPYLLMSDDTPAPGVSAPEPSADDPVLRYTSILSRDDTEAAFRNMHRHGGIYLEIAGTRHNNFSDEASASPFRRWSGSGPISPRRALTIVNSYVVAFFENALNGRPSRLLSENSSEYPEVRLRTWHPETAMTQQAKNP